MKYPLNSNISLNSADQRQYLKQILLAHYLEFLALYDSIGVDTVWKVTDFWVQKRQDKKTLANVAFLKEYVEQGGLGIKTGKGFYDYPNPAYLAKDVLEPKN